MTFLFGKLPAHGDFVARGLTAEAREGLDAWLSASLAQARAQLANRFVQEYEQAPPWRFAWAGEGGWTAGAMAPSVDAVGRRYPLLLALERLGDAQVEQGAEIAETLLYDALAQGWDADRLDAAAQAAAPRAGERWNSGERWWTLGGERFGEPALAGARPDELLTAMLTPIACEERA